MCALRFRRNWQPSRRHRAARIFPGDLLNARRKEFAMPGRACTGALVPAHCKALLGRQHKERTLAVKIVRQPNKIALIGAPTSAAAFFPGSEKAPAALRDAGIVDRLKSIGYEVTDLGDCKKRLFADDEEHKRARNLP